VPQAQELSGAELLERIQAGYGPARRQALGSQSFVESHFYNLKQKLGYQRRHPATRLTALGCASERRRLRKTQNSKLKTLTLSATGKRQN
jgi:hypothetical protein